LTRKDRRRNSSFGNSDRLREAAFRQLVGALAATQRKRTTRLASINSHLLNRLRPKHGVEERVARALR